MKKNYLKGLAILLLATINFVYSQQTVVFNTNSLSNGVIEEGAGSLNSSWLLDSDIHRPRNTSNESRWAEMGLGAVRYPYGMGENYLWDTPPYGSSPLVPKVASMDKAPGTMSWVTNSDGTMDKIMDFDEFMSICQRQNIKPLIVISTQAHKYTNGPTYQELKTTAVEWVKYAKRKGYEVAYWQLGNEVDGHTDILPEAEYYDLYVDFVTAMKAADPSIVCGLGIKRRPSYFNNLMARAPELIDYTSVHQYMTGAPYTDYDSWLAHPGTDFMTNLSGIQNVVNNSSKPELPILITESNAFLAWADNDVNFFKGLAWFDMLMTQQSYEDVVYSFLWSSHSPWRGVDTDGGIANAMTNDADNALRPMGSCVKIFNTTVEEKFMIPDNKVHGPTYSYGSYTPGTENMTIYLLNKSIWAIPMNVNINNYTMPSDYERWVWAPTGDQYSSDFTYTERGSIVQTNNGFTTTLPPHSLVVVKLKSVAPISFMDNVKYTVRMKANSTNNDVITTSTADNGWRGKWKIINAGNGYVYIQNQANGMRLQGSSTSTGVETSVKLVPGSYTGTWVQWELQPVGSNWFIVNRAHNTKLSVKSTGEIIVNPIYFNGDAVQWKLTDPTSNSSKESNDKNSTQVIVDTSEVLIYPTSITSGDDFNLNYTSKENNSILELRVMDVSGKTIISKRERLNSGINKLKVESKGLSQGLYFVELISNGIRNTKKIVIK